MKKIIIILVSFLITFHSFASIDDGLNYLPPVRPMEETSKFLSIINSKKFPYIAIPSIILFNAVLTTIISFLTKPNNKKKWYYANDPQPAYRIDCNLSTQGLPLNQLVNPVGTLMLCNTTPTPSYYSSLSQNFPELEAFYCSPGVPHLLPYIFISPEFEHFFKNSTNLKILGFYMTLDNSTLDYKERKYAK